MADSPLYLSTHGQQPTATGDPAKIGDLRRRYNFGAAVTELAIDQTPFFRFVSQVANKPTDDPEFKTTEERSMWHKRYAYAVAIDLDTPVPVLNDDAGYVHTAFSNAELAQDQTFAIKFECDYESAGNVQSILGQTAVTRGATGTKPIFFLDGQLVKIPLFKTTVNNGAVGTVTGRDYMIVQISAVGDGTSDTEAVYATCTVIRPAASGYNALGLAVAHASDGSYDTMSASGHTEEHKCYVVGSAHAEGSTFPSTFKDSPYLVRTGYTQIFKTTMQMTNTARATQLKLVSDEWGRIWKNKLIEHKWDIEQALLFGRGYVTGDGSTSRTSYTQGAVDYILQEGNVFSWTTAKDSDDFLEDMSDFLDPRYNNSNSTLFMCSTDVYNWLHKLGGYFAQNVNAVGAGTANGMGRADFAVTGKSNKYGLGITTISTPYGNMNVTRNIHLDSGQGGAKIVGVNMKHVAYRPLVGNGLNRDTSIYVGVQSLENTGVDRRIDLIQTESGLQIVMPEAHAVWTG
ncbi:hypothetical protein CMI47_07050 [Candidatus Pacearchaeota archaeon]|nr:hypothetical protein [Candidatus Pacearchaeota archaeon]|tara:strand:+ start:6496 stop:8040 length:1545 start_codon:yes stop_codon:yes gene_type:complete